MRLKAFSEKFLADTNNADIVVGCMTDDRFFRSAKIFLRNDLSLKDLEDIFLSGYLGTSIFLQSEKIVKESRLKFVGYTEVPYKDWYSKKKTRENKITVDFEKIENRPSTENDIMIEDVLKNDGWKFACTINELSFPKFQISK